VGGRTNLDAPHCNGLTTPTRRRGELATSPDTVEPEGLRSGRLQFSTPDWLASGPPNDR
jgi:hypothetical protein